MDTQAVWSASEEDLNLLGLKERGDIICVKWFCMPSKPENDLADSIKEAGKDIKKKKLKQVHLLHLQSHNAKQFSSGGCTTTSLHQSIQL